MEKKSKLILAQVDHVSGELLGFSVEKLLKIGARNVQMIPTITIKSRPGTIMIIDIPEDQEKFISDFLAKELKISGYHRIETSHVFQEVNFIQKRVVIYLNGHSESFRCEVKIVGDPADPLAVDVEHDFLVEVQKVLDEKLHSPVPLMELRGMIESRLKESGDEITLEI